MRDSTSRIGSILYLITVTILMFAQPLHAVGIDNQHRGETAMLINTYWKLTELEGIPVITGKGQREMKLTLHEKERVNGFAGCNSFFGSYTYDGSKITFSQLAVSRKFCAETMDQETLFLKSLSAIAGYKITGQKLQLIDDQGKLHMRFKAVYLK